MMVRWLMDGSWLANGALALTNDGSTSATGELARDVLEKRAEDTRSRGPPSEGPGEAQGLSPQDGE